MTEEETWNLTNMPDDILREIRDRLGSANSYKNMRDTCREFRRICTDVPNPYQVIFDRLQDTGQFHKNWPTYPDGSYILPLSAKKWALFFIQAPGIIYIIPNCTWKNSPMIRLTTENLEVRLMSGVMTKKRNRREITILTMGAWMLYEGPRLIQEFCPTLKEAIAAL